MTRQAILVIDMLNDFIHEKGALVCPNGKKIVPNIQRLLTWIRGRKGDDIQIVHIQEAHRKHDADFRVRPCHAVAGSWGADFIEELKPMGDDQLEIGRASCRERV